MLKHPNIIVDYLIPFQLLVFALNILEHHYSVPNLGILVWSF